MSFELSADLIGMLVATLLTLCVFSYLLGDNFFYRLAVAILAGGGAAYVLMVTWWNIVVPRVFVRLFDQADPAGASFAVVAAVMGILVLFKWYPRFAWVGNIPLAYLVGVGVGLAFGGALLGTLFGQAQAAASGQGSRLIPVIDPLLRLGITLTVFVSFAFLTGGQRGLSGMYARAVSAISLVGQFCMALAFGAVFASVYLASLSVLVSRVQFILEAVNGIRQWVAVLMAGG